MSIQSEIDRLATVKADLKAAINGASGATVGDVFGDYPGAITSGKAAIASAITEKGVTTAADATFQQMATNIGAIETGGGSVNVLVSTSKYPVTLTYVDSGEPKRTTVPLVSSAEINVSKSTIITCNWDGASITINSGNASVFEDYFVFVEGDCDISLR